MAEKKSKLSILEFVVTFMAIFLVVNYGYQYFYGKKADVTPKVSLVMTDATVATGSNPIVTIKNDTDKDLMLPPRCPVPAVDIAFVEAKPAGDEKTELIPNQSILPCVDIILVKAHSSVAVDLASWKYSLFDRTGAYEASLQLPEGFSPGNPENVASVRFAVNDLGFFTKIFRTFITKPLFNSLVFIASWVPGHNLGIAIILLTILVKLVLLLPNQHALEGQRKLQMLQPRMDELKRKYPNDATKVQEETMKLWKEMKINPLQSCLPTLLQLPILIGLFFVIQDGVSIETSRHMLYSFYHDLPANFLGYNFLGFDLLKPSVFIMPPLLVILQFIQMKMMMAKSKKKDEIVVKPVNKTWAEKLDQQTIMTYVMPLMIGFFAFKFPVAVSLYWAVSTLFGIAQQYYVMKEKLKLKPAA